MSIILKEKILNFKRKEENLEGKILKKINIELNNLNSFESIKIIDAMIQEYIENSGLTKAKPIQAQ